MVDPLWIIASEYNKGMTNITTYVQDFIDSRINADSTNIYQDLMEDNMNVPKGSENREIYGIVSINTMVFLYSLYIYI